MSLVIVNRATDEYKNGLITFSSTDVTNASYNVATTDELLMVDCTSYNITVNLLSAVGKNNSITISRRDNSSYELNIQAYGGELINGNSIIKIVKQYTTVTLVAVNNNWIMI